MSGGQVFRVILEAVRTRTAQALTVVILAALAAAGAAAAPWYGLAVAARAAEAEIAAAPGSERVLTADQPGSPSGDPRAALTRYAATVRGLLGFSGGTPVLGMSQEMVYIDRGSADATSGFAAAYRDGFCAHVRLTGTCPAAAHEGAISADAAQRLRLTTGRDLILQTSPSAPAVHFHIVAIYQRIEPGGEYWSNPLFSANGELDPLFTPLATFTDPQFTAPRFGYDLEVPHRLLRGDNGYDLNGVLNAAQDRFDAAQMSLVNPVGKLLDRVRADRLTILRGVLIALVQVLVLAGFTIGLAGRYTGRDRRGDAALLKLRGNTRLSILRLTVGQHLVPLVAGGVVGTPIGVLAAWGLAGALPVRAELGLALAFGAAAVAAMVVAGLLVLLAVDAVALRQPVATLLRTVPPGRRDWRADVVDLLLVLVAAGAVYQARSSRPDSGLGLVAPALVALAVALLLARLLGWIADRAGAAAVRRGRLRFGLTAIQMSRQPGTDRVLALIVVAVAMLATAIGGFAAGRTQRADRAEVELGAARVLTVQAANRTALEYAVRRADPGGRHAMAAVIDRTTNPPVLAVDSTRLAAVARWRPEYGSPTALPDAIAAANLPPGLPRITGTRLALGVRNDRAVPATLDLFLQNDATGAPVRVEFAGIAPGERTVTARLGGCSTAPGCRLVRWQLFTPAGRDGSPVTGAVTIRSLTQQNPPARILDAALLDDVTRWHTDVSGSALRIATGRGLTMSADFGQTATPGDKVYAVDAPLPLPVVLAGPEPVEWHFQDASSLRFGPVPTPVRVVGTARVLPVLGAGGILVDLDAVRRIAADAELGGTFQVWLTPDTPPSTVDALRRAGLTVVRDYSVTARTAQLSARPDVIGAARFGLLTVTGALLIAAAAVAVATATDLGPQTDQLRALRHQGLPLRVATGVAYAGVATLIGAGLIGGLLAAALAGPVANVAVPPFPDGWQVLAPPGPLGAAALGTAGLIGLVVVGLTGWLAVRPLVRRLTFRSGGPETASRGGDR